MPRLFSRFDTTAPAGLVPASSAPTLFRFANFAFIFFKNLGWALPVKSAIFAQKKKDFVLEMANLEPLDEEAPKRVLSFASYALSLLL